MMKEYPRSAHLRASLRAHLPQTRVHLQSQIVRSLDQRMFLAETTLRSCQLNTRNNPSSTRVSPLRTCFGQKVILRNGTVSLHQLTMPILQKNDRLYRLEERLTSHESVVDHLDLLHLLQSCMFGNLWNPHAQSIRTGHLWSHLLGNRLIVLYRMLTQSSRLLQSEYQRQLEKLTLFPHPTVDAKKSLRQCLLDHR